MDPEIELGDVTPYVDGSADWIDGEDDLLDYYSTLNMDKIKRRDVARREEEVEEAHINKVIKEEVVENFINSAVWSIRKGTMGGRRMQQRFEERLIRAGAEARELRKRRADLGLNTLDMVDRIHGHRKLESLMEEMLKLEIRPAPREDMPHHKLGFKLDALLTARRLTECAVKDLENSLHLGERE